MKLGERWYLTQENFDKIFSELEEKGFEKISREALFASLKKKKSVPFLKKKNEGIERGYMFEVSSKYRDRKRKVFVWGTYVDAIHDIKEHDYIWMGIEDEGNPDVFFWFPIKRTLNFVENTVEHAQMHLDIVMEWPRCPQCGHDLYLRFVGGGILHLMKFVCGNGTFIHTAEVKKFYPIFDMPLKDERSSELLVQGFYDSLNYQHANSLREKPRESARLIRAENKKLALQRHNQKHNQYGDIRPHRDDLYFD